MENSAIFETAPRGEQEYESAIERLLDEMQRMKTAMDAKQQRIEKTRAEIESLLADLKF
jgi:hypothetical protein